MRIPTQVSAVKGDRKSKRPDPSEMSFLSRMLIPVCMNGLVIPTAFSRAAVRVNGAIARSASCREQINTLKCAIRYHIPYIYAYSERGLRVFNFTNNFAIVSPHGNKFKLMQWALLPFDLFKRQFSCTYPSHHLSNHPIPAPLVILSAVRTILHQLHSVTEAQFLGYLRQKVHAKAFQLCALGNCVWLLL